MGDMPAIQYIPFHRIPGHSKLFLDYVALKEKALSFYRFPPTIRSIQISSSRAADNPAPRREMVELLRQQNRLFQCGERTEENIESLGRHDSVAIVTGQQVGLFSGPAYTIYKALTTLRLVEELRKRKVRAVPIFWMESEDHDLAEVSRLIQLDSNFRAHLEDFRELLFGDQAPQGRSVGSIALPDKIGGLIEIYGSRLADGPGRGEAMRLLESAYRSGFSLGEAFGRFMASLFKDQGLVLFDSQTPGARKLISGLFGKVISNMDSILGALRDRNGSLADAGYSSQVGIQDDSTLLFLQKDGERRALIKKGTNYSLKNSDLPLSPRELARRSLEAPETLSPNVLLRPLVQDSLFPTAAYVGGPSEIAYFAQIEVLYSHLHLPMPVIWPRGSASILDSDIARPWRDSGLSHEDCFSPRDSLIQKLLEKDSPNRRVLSRLRSDVSHKIGALGPLMGRVDPTLESSARTAERKILHNIDKLETRISKMEERENTRLVAMAERYIAQSFPGRHLQERALGIPYFISRYGPGIVNLLYSLTEVDRFEHCLIEMEQV